MWMHVSYDFQGNLCNLCPVCIAFVIVSHFTQLNSFCVREPAAHKTVKSGGGLQHCCVSLCMLLCATSSGLLCILLLWSLAVCTPVCMLCVLAHVLLCVLLLYAVMCAAVCFVLCIAV